MKHWQLQQAKARLSELLRAAEREGPQEITVRGEARAVLLSRKDYERLTRRKPRFVDFLRSSPLAGVDLPLERDRSAPREISL